MEKKGKILIVDDNEDVLLSLNMLLKPYVEGIRVINTPERIIGMMDSFMPDVIMLDMNFHRDAISGEEGYEWLKKILAHNPKSVVLFITAYVDTEKAVRAIKAGAIDFIPKPWDRNKLLDTVKSAVELSRERKLDSSDSQEKESEQNMYQNLNMNQCSESKSIASSEDVFARMIGECPAMKELKAQMMRVAATNANLREKVGEGTFRQDLFYRLNTIELHLPPLRERGEDIVLLAEYFLKIYSGKYSVGDVVLGASAKQKLLKHTWPGNVRELQHCIERAIVLGDKTELAAEDIRLEDSVVALGSSSSDSSSSSSSGSIKVDSLNLQTLEREAIKRAISLSNGNLTQAAELLGITRFALYRKIDKLGV